MDWPPGAHASVQRPSVSGPNGGLESRVCDALTGPPAGGVNGPRMAAKHAVSARHRRSQVVALPMPRRAPGGNLTAANRIPARVNPCGTSHALWTAPLDHRLLDTALDCNNSTNGNPRIDGRLLGRLFPSCTERVPVKTVSTMDVVRPSGHPLLHDCPPSRRGQLGEHAPLRR